MEPRETKYVALEDSRKLCLECLDSAIMDTNQCQPLYLDIQEFYERLNMKVEQQVPLLLVERQALNEAMDGEKSGHHHMPKTRGLCLFEEQTVSTILRHPKIGAGNRAMNMITEPYKLIHRCEVTAILILFGLPSHNLPWMHKLVERCGSNRACKIQLACSLNWQVIFKCKSHQFGEAHFLAASTSLYKDEIVEKIAKQSQPNVTNPRFEVQIFIDMLGKRSGYLEGYGIRMSAYAT
ncbi:hypothetical protein RHMOL_Rhmol01G0221400 [Rhododendron molle]|uniref:Uncharacterized protein n=1 Tax=Rhododendron molle TaxID=49168 RepID=A0ACC0Q4P6_RHOML|nr:hypothetical protein RHMOL_Rhmol01G0221400 [Rhododendron molle]